LRRDAIRKEEVRACFAQIDAVVRSRLSTLKTDLPGALVGRSEAEIERIVTERIEHTLGNPESFFNP
jgi:hypothetical protein